jgi:cellulose synthase (UDP-forming)
MRRPRQPELSTGGFVNALRPHDRLVLAAIAGLWLASAVFFWQWWFAPVHRVTVPGLVANTVVLGFDLVAVPLWFFFFLLRMRRPQPAVEVPAAANGDRRHQGPI